VTSVSAPKSHRMTKTRIPKTAEPDSFVLYTKDFSDVEDVVRVLTELKKLRLVEGSYKIYYKPGKLIRVGLCYAIVTSGLLF